MQIFSKFSAASVGAVGAVGDFVRNRQRDAFGQSLTARQAIGIRNQVPVGRAAEVDLGNRLQRIAWAHDMALHRARRGCRRCRAGAGCSELWTVAAPGWLRRLGRYFSLAGG